MGTGQRRPSRSPRSQRSRSADVDCLKKYTERRVEERRHTEVSDTSKLDPSRWIPLPRNIAKGQPAVKKSPQTSREDEKRRSTTTETIEESVTEATRLLSTPQSTPKRLSPKEEEERKASVDEKSTESRGSPFTLRQSAGRSYSADVSHVKNHEKLEERRHTECSDPRAIATRWIPQINTSRFRHDATTFARTSCEITRNAATRWMTFVKNPSPCPIPRMNPDRKSPAADAEQKDPKKESAKWEPLRKFSPVSSKTDKEAGQKHDELNVTAECVPPKQSPDSSERSSRLNQRIKDLYDFKTENEWPKRASSPRPENTWISKSSSEDEKNNHRIRRNSQDLEFNERMGQIKLRDTKIHSKMEESPRILKKGSAENSGEVFTEGREERLRKFHEKLRYSEDLGVSKPRVKERRTYSDDYDEKARRASRMIRNEEVPHTGSPKDKKRDSDASARSAESRASYAEVGPVKRNSRVSEVSYASISSCPTKRGSIECKSTRKMFEIPPRRAFSQTEERPGTPVPPVEFNDDRYVPVKLVSERQTRDSTRYKVYLT